MGKSAEAQTGIFPTIPSPALVCMSTSSPDDKYQPETAGGWVLAYSFSCLVSGFSDVLRHASHLTSSDARYGAGLGQSSKPLKQPKI